MDRSDVITLVDTTYAKDANGVERPTETTKEVFCSVNSVTRNEFMEGGRNGLNPELYFIVFFGDYSGEETIIYKGKSYGVYRTFLGKNDNLELYCERKGGTNGSR